MKSIQFNNKQKNSTWDISIQSISKSMENRLSTDAYQQNSQPHERYVCLVDYLIDVLFGGHGIIVRFNPSNLLVCACLKELHNNILNGTAAR